MKKSLLFFLLSLLGMTQAVAQDSGWDWDESGYLHIVREGVKWVNEKVIINHGDTTSFYYIYEFNGEDNDPRWTNMNGQINKACYYYTGDNLDVERDSLIAGLRDNSEVTCFRNHAYDKVLEEDRALFRLMWYSDGGTKILYNFYYPRWNCVGYYLDCQEWSQECYGTEPFLEKENFTEIEPLEIEGYSCSRYTYVNEQGEPLCYIVEGIGFDSYNMGDLLTPFTREPDPDADYQEYCGLCHVVKDGQIIYKGMRYTPDNMTGVDEVRTDQPKRHNVDDNYYNLMGQAVGKALPSAPGIYIHQGKKIVVR
jgi:hypothetical protein